MGMAAAIIGGLAASVGMSAMMNRKSSSGGSMYEMSTPAQQIPQMPETPTVETTATGTTNNALMEAEREKERQAALLRRQNAPEILTSGLGATGQVGLAKKGLLGG